MNSLEDLANRVADLYRSFDFSEADSGSVCCYDVNRDKITLNFDHLSKYVDRFKLLHELSHRVQRQLMQLYGDTSHIEINANKIAYEAYQKLGLRVTDEIIYFINYNNLKQLLPELTDKEASIRAKNSKELIWRL